MVALVGQTGAGKSTALNLILGQIKPTTGTVTVHGCDPFKDFQALRGQVAVSFQSDRLIPWRTAGKNVELGLEILHFPKQDGREKAEEWRMRVELANLHHDKYPDQMSGGMRQRVSLARALVVDPDLVLLDESFSQLDQVTSKALRARLPRADEAVQEDLRLHHAPYRGCSGDGGPRAACWLRRARSSWSVNLSDADRGESVIHHRRRFCASPARWPLACILLRKRRGFAESLTRLGQIKELVE